MTAPVADGLTWGVVALATAGVIARPWKLPEAVWAVSGAVLLVALGLLPARVAAAGVGKGLDVYFFLTGMMLLSEIARREGLFDTVAALAVARAGGSPRRLFLLVYAVGTVVTALLSNDATAVVLTPAVFAAARRARVDPLPYVLVCAFVANAASFVLPISNPANLVLYGGRVPPLGRWLAAFALPSALSVAATYAALRLTAGRRLGARCEGGIGAPPLTAGGRGALAGIALTAVVLLAASALDRPLGVPTAAMGVLTAAAVLVRTRSSPAPVLRGIAWAVLPLVAGLFVLVEALDRTGVIRQLAAVLRAGVHASPAGTPWAAGVALAVASNFMNNLPAGLVASATLAQAHPPPAVTDALLIGVDLGPNLSVTGSLATILWLAAVRREGQDVGFGRFLRVGLLVMPPALLLALAARLVGA
ncbi:arsenic transporter [Gemmatimonadetes bacterium T265]|nr:arsenic transporter [Gemmatimonadetes bacterium T265]